MIHNFGFLLLLVLFCDATGLGLFFIVSGKCRTCQSWCDFFFNRFWFFTLEGKHSLFTIESASTYEYLEDTSHDTSTLHFFFH